MVSKGSQVGIAVLLLAWTGGAVAQCITQALDLLPGWNAVYFEVDPRPASCDEVFSDLPVDSVWMWNERSDAPQFVQDPTKLTPDQPEWLHWFPPGPISNQVTDLFVITGGRPYLIKLGGSTTRQVVVTGVPRLRAPGWTSGKFTFAGFPLDTTQGPTFSKFFAPDKALADQPVYTLDAAGRWNLVPNPISARMKRGEAYWIRADGRSNYAGPLALEFDTYPALEFSDHADVLNLRMRNRAVAARTVTLRLLPSATPPDPTFPASAGPVVLATYDEDLAANVKQYTPFTEKVLALPAGGSLNIEFEVRRKDLAPQADGSVGFYQGILEISDGDGMRIHVPVSTLGLKSSGHVTAKNNNGTRLQQVENPRLSRGGLWVGQVAINAVNEPRNSANPDMPRPTRGEFQFRLIVHVDAAGQARLLQSALIMFREGVLEPDPENPTLNRVAQKGAFVILTDDSLLNLKRGDGEPLYSGSSLRDGTKVGRRISSVNFCHTEPLAMQGPFGDPATPLLADLVIPFNDPLNPFVHRYHPDHDNLDRNFQPYAQGGTESAEIKRHLALTFTDSDPTSSTVAGYGASLVGGVYEERIEGLHKHPLRIKGTFQLAHVLDVAELNDGRK
jgi:hypothetical protein